MLVPKDLTNLEDLSNLLLMRFTEVGWPPNQAKPLRAEC